jgi:hypothetical protein
MASSGLKGSFALTDEKIDEEVTKTSPGAYALGYTSDETFHIKYVGRSDSDVNDRLHDWAGKYKRFKYDYFGSAKAAFEKECNLYHDFDPVDNRCIRRDRKGLVGLVPAAMLWTRTFIDQVQHVLKRNLIPIMPICALRGVGI